MSIKQAIEALEKIEQLTEHGPREYARAALAALRSMPTTLGKGITRDDTVHGEEYFTRSQVEAVRSMPAEPVDDALNTLCKMMHSGEEVEGDDGLAMLVPIDLWNEAQEAIELLVGEDDATPHTEAVRMSEAEIERIADVNYQRGEEIGYRKGQASKRPLLSDEAMQTIGRWLNADMDLAVSNGADSRSMPDELVEIAGWLCDVPIEQATAARLGVTLTLPERER